MRHEKAVLAANAKINLSLDVGRRREDGYHRLVSVMQSVTLSDRITIEDTGSGRMEFFCSDPSLSAAEDNIAYRAAQAYLRASGMGGAGARIELVKRIPQQAGMGGGSADAAAVLLGMCAVYGPLPARVLEREAFALGADVPFCLRGGAMLARGAGEILSPLPPLPDCFIVAVMPRFTISTAYAYSAFDRYTAGAGPDLRAASQDVCDALRAHDLKKTGRALGNMLECAAPAEISQIKKTFADCGAFGACMTGSGSAVYGIFDDIVPASDCARVFETDKRIKAFICSPAGRGVAVDAGETEE
jgi:4-diphosphocytidyl-2-C-methyl-D-erythritol kinase